MNSKIDQFLSLFSIFVSTGGMVFQRQAFNEANAVDRKFRDYTNIPIVPEKYPLLTVLVPARNEERNIQDCLDSIFAQDYPNFEVIAIDDNSSDKTPLILQKLAAANPEQLKILNANPPTEGWLGKPNALWQGYQEVKPECEWVLFFDADVTLLPCALRATVEYARREKLDLLSMVAGLASEGVSFWHKLLIGEVSKFYTLAYLNHLHPPKKGLVEEASAIGTFILVRKEAYDVVGGHAAVRDSLIEDLMLARKFRSHDFTTAQVLGLNYLQTRGYANFSEIWEGVTKNLFVVAHKNWLLVAFLVGVEFLYGITPFIQLFRFLFDRSKQIKSNKTGFALNLISILMLFSASNQLNRKFKIPWFYALLFPFTAVITCSMLLASAFKTQFLKKVDWKGRKIRV